MNGHRLPHSRPSWALALALALLLLTGWGQVHRVLHPGVTAAHVLSEAAASAQTSYSAHLQAPVHLGHEAEGGLCLLLDHLADGSVPLASPVLPMAGPPPASVPGPLVLSLPAASPRPFHARGPPLLA